MGRRLGPKQMTTDTAVRVTRIVAEQKSKRTTGTPNIVFSLCMSLISAVALDDIPYLDYPELKFNEHESTQMPFRYVKGDDGKPIMPEVRLPPRLIKEDAHRCVHCLWNRILTIIGNGGLDSQGLRQGH